MCSLLAQNTYYAYSIAVIFHNLDLKKELNLRELSLPMPKSIQPLKIRMPIFLTNQDCNILEMNSNMFDTDTISNLFRKQGKNLSF